jgi:uncharacterized membrane protein
VLVKSRLIIAVLALVLVSSLVAGFLITQKPVSAQTATPTPTPTPTTTPDNLQLQSTYPSLSADSGQPFSFSVDIKYSGSRQLLNLTSTQQSGWDVSFNNSAGKTITAVQLGPVDYTVTETVTVVLTPSLGQTPNPGNYPLTVTVSNPSGSLNQSINLTATVKAKFSFIMDTASGNLNSQATAGADNHTAIQLTNQGTAAIDALSLTSTQPDGWIVKFNPDKVDSIGAGQKQQVDVTITPPGGKTVAGDYMLNLTASNGTLSQTMNLRVTVLTPTVWGWVGLIIVILVIAGLGVLFMKLGRR